MRDIKPLAFLLATLLTVSSARVSLDYPGRVVAMGDFHGDWNAFISILLTTKLIEKVAKPDKTEQTEEVPILQNPPSFEFARFTGPRRLNDKDGTIGSDIYQKPEYITIGTSPKEGEHHLSRFDSLYKRVFGVPSSEDSKPITEYEMKDLIDSEEEMPTSKQEGEVARKRIRPTEDMEDWRSFQEKRVEEYRWIGGETVLVQTGDMVDRGPDTIALYTLLMRLKKQAKEAGGEVINLLGNHETMNMCGDLRYVSDQDYATFGPLLSKEEQKKNRAKAFSKDGFLGKWISSQDSVAKVGRTVYSHAGILEAWAQLTIPEMNELIRLAIEDDCEANVIFSRDGPQWNRVYYAMMGEERQEVCETVTKVLIKLNADRMVIGHNALPDGQILERCKGKLFLIDVGMSADMHNNPPAALETLYQYHGEGNNRVTTDVQMAAIYSR